MEVIEAAVHYISKSAHSEEVEVTPAVGVIEVSPELTVLVNEVLETYNARCAQQSGVFQSDEVNYPLSSVFRDYHNGEIDFLPATVTAANRLAILMKRQPLSTGGHLLFARYSRGEEHFLLIVKLNSSKGSMFEDLTRVKASVHLTVHTLQVAARINLSAWMADSGARYLSFVCKRELGHPSIYFRDFIGCDLMSDSRVESGKLATVVDEFCKQLKTAGQLSEDASVAIMRRVFDYATELASAREPVSLAAIASLVSPDDIEQFNTFLNSHPNKPTDEFIADKGSLRKLSGYSYNSKEFNLKMTHQFKADHRVRVENNQLIIDNPPTRLEEELEN